MPQPKILFCDDELYLNSAFIDELLLANFEVLQQRGVDGCLEVLRRERVDLLIIDIMMSPGIALADADTADGRRTGVFLYDRIRQDLSSLPIIILTNVSSVEVEKKFAAEARCVLLRKDQCLPFELVEEVNAMLRPR